MMTNEVFIILAATTEVASNSESVWGVLQSVVTGLLGVGGLAAILKVLNDRRKGIRQDDRDDDAAISARWQQLLDAQITTLVGPLRERISELEKKQESMANDLYALKSLYRISLEFNRKLLKFIREENYDIVEKHPDIPEELRHELK